MKKLNLTKALIIIIALLTICTLALSSCNMGNNSGGNTDGGTDDDDNAADGDDTAGGEDEDDESLPWWSNISYGKSDIVVQLTRCSNNEELSSGSEKYLAGIERPDENDSEDFEFDRIDELVELRNNNANLFTKVNAKYRYYEDVIGICGYSKSFDVIYNEVANHTYNSPDIYSSFVCDMVCASLKGAFSNLHSTSHGTGDYRGANYFSFDAAGYMKDYMESLTLNPDKTYVIASDYFIDLIRAFYVVPVNVNLFNTVASGMIADHNHDGEKNVLDLMVEVYAGDWTYDRLAEFSAYTYSYANDGAYGDKISDVLGFGLATNGLVSKGLVYSSSIDIINKTGGYSYPDSCEALDALCDAIATLVGRNGVAVITNSDATALGEFTSMLAVRELFTSGKMLFGGITQAASLEYEQYRAMKSDGGFAIVPVPMVDGMQTQYSTQIHHTGRAGAISARTTKFVQCSAFIQYQTENSADVVTEYYKSTFGAEVSGINTNIEMMRYLRRNLKSGFQMCYEAATEFLAPYESAISENEKWHVIICNGQYDVTNMGDLYKTYVGPKSASLANLVAIYDTLPS